MLVPVTAAELDAYELSWWGGGKTEQIGCSLSEGGSESAGGATGCEGGRERRNEKKDEEDAVEASADAEFSDEEPPARALRTGHMSREAARAAVDSPSFLNGLGDAAGAARDEDEEEEEEPIRRKRPRR